MTWNVFDMLPKRVVRYLLNRYFGKYLEAFNLDDLSCGLKQGKGLIENVLLNVESLNELSEEYNFPFEFLQGSIDYVSICVPLRGFLRENIVIEIKGLRFIVQPKERAEDVSMFESMLGSMTTSMQLAQECVNLKTDEEDDFYECEESKSPGAVKTVAQAIDKVFSSTKVVFHDSSLKIEHVPRNGSSGVSLEIKIANAEYFDEAETNIPKSDSNSGSKQSSSENQAHSFKKIIFEGVSLFTAQFSTQSRAFPTKIIPTSDCMESSGFVPGSPEMPPTHSSLPMKKLELELHDDPILISKLTGKQELKLKLKQSDQTMGPKVDVEFNLGSLNLFLIPQQVHMLYEILSGLMKPSSNNDPNNRPFSVVNKPMRPADYALVEEELLLHQQKSHTHSRSLKNQHGWSSHSLGESDEDFQPMPMENRQGSDFQTSPFNDNDSLCSSISSDTRSDSAGHLYGGNQRPSRRRGSHVQTIINDQQLTELTHFRGCCSSLFIVILHDDSVQESLSKNSSDSSKHNCRKLFSLKERAETFFNDLLALQQSGVDFKDFASMREPLSELCDTNHLRLLASSVSIEGNQKSSSARCEINFSLSLFQFELLECLFNSANLVNKPHTPTYVEMLTCGDKVNVNEAYVKEACFRLKYKQIEFTTQNRQQKPPANKLDIQFGPLSSELDISLTDRIQTLLNFENLFGQKDTKTDDWTYSDVNVTRCSPKTEVTISCPALIVNLRFPIPDLRSVHDMDRVPWWQQNLHPEILIMEAKDVTFITSLNEDILQSKYEIQCRDLHGLFKHSTADEPISFLRVSVDPDVDEISQNNGFDWPRLVIHTTTNVSGGDLETGLEEHEELCSYSFSEMLMSNMKTEPSPFLSYSEVRGSKLETSDFDVEMEGKTNMSFDHDEVIKPADKVTINNFIEQAVSKSECFLEFSLPTANVILPSKEFFEMLYNRLGSDLLLWQKTTLSPKAPYDTSSFKVHIPGLDFSSHIPNDQGFEKLSVFRPLSSDSDSEEEEAVFCSMYEFTQREKQKQKRTDVNNAFTKLSITVAITKGNLTFHTPAMDSSDKVLPDVCGKFQLQVEDGQIFIASSYKGDKNESYLCVLAEKSTLYHNAAVVKQVNFPVVETFRGSRPNDVNCIIYESEPGMLLKSFACDTSKICDMLKIAVNIINCPKLPLKSFKVAIDISGATLRHHVHSSLQIWINQLIDFLKVRDLPVSGYVPSDVVTEFHLNLSNCAIDYRPLFLPILCAITMESFNMSCNISATTPSFLFRIISDKMRFFLSNNIAAKKVELRKNYVCVIDSGLIDISSRTKTEKNEQRQEICITNNVIDIRTCPDTAKALMELIIYVSADGDIADDLPEDKVEKDEEMSPSDDLDVEKLNLMMAEAMKDCSKSRNSDDCIKNGDNTVTDYDMLVNTDDEFCILEDDPGVGLKPRNGEPQIRILTDEPFEMIENHFCVPPGKSDVLKAPKHFPKPVLSFSLREMSLNWYLYGGSDFKKVNSAKTRSKRNKEKDLEVTFSDEKKVEIGDNNSSVSFCKVTPLTKNFGAHSLKYSMETVTIDQTKESDPNSWLKQGGPNRNEDVLMVLEMRKIKFQRDVYAPDNQYASRYVLLISDIEILDKLKSSNINKFLYQYYSQKILRQANADMVEIKANYTRPDPNLTIQECTLQVSCKPLKLNIDQDSFLFLMAYFREVMGITEDNSEETDGKETNENNSIVTSYQVRDTPSSNSSTETFYRVFTFAPELFIRIDYQGKRVDMEQGAVAGLFLGLVQLNGSEIKLKRICHRHGLLGHHKVLSYALEEWKKDILKNQLPGIFGGVGPMRSFLQIFQGCTDAVVIPFAQFKKDGQIIRGLKNGAVSFSSETFVGTLNLCEGFANTIKKMCSLVLDLSSSGPNKLRLTRKAYRHTSQPADIREGLANAVTIVKEGFNDAALHLYRTTVAQRERKGLPSALGALMLEVIPSSIEPINSLAEAGASVFKGASRSIRPDAHQEDIQKWKTKNS